MQHWNQKAHYRFHIPISKWSCELDEEKKAHGGMCITGGKIYGSSFCYQIKNIFKEATKQVSLQSLSHHKDFDKKPRKHYTYEKPYPPQEYKTYWYPSQLCQGDGDCQWGNFWMLPYVKHGSWCFNQANT